MLFRLHKCVVVALQLFDFVCWWAHSEHTAFKRKKKNENKMTGQRTHSSLDVGGLGLHGVSGLLVCFNYVAETCHYVTETCRHQTTGCGGGRSQ